MSGGLTKIKNIKTYENINYRPLPFNRVNVNVGERSIVGIPYLRNNNFKPVDARVSNTARLGQTSSLPDRRKKMKGMDGEGHTPEHMEEMEGEGFFKDVGKAVKKVAKLTKKGSKIVKKGAKIVEVGATIAGREDIAEKARGVRKTAGRVERVSKAIGGGKISKSVATIGKVAGVASPAAAFLGNPIASATLGSVAAVAKPVSMGLKLVGLGEEDQEEQPVGRGVRGNERMSFVATHPMNYRKARLASMMRA